SKKGGLAQNEIGLITVLDHSSYVAIKNSAVKDVLRKVKGEKVKGKRLKIALSK
ncbi:MAG: DbpA RNA binding domain-containing protein, partial [Crocinitomicaceae bacterium]|nr:DbpA RNA binding domain-containing protein [Crocinitomicaceae bacterium]